MRTFSLPPEDIAFIDEKVSSGHYTSGSEVVQAALRALQERDMAIEDWLHNAVTPTYDTVMSAGGKTHPAGSVFKDIRRRNASRTEKP
jgi:antitoxin ParD1/3/4